MSGSHKISIAVLTRSQDDVEQINRTLRGEGHAAHCLWISRPEKLDAALAKEPVELLILNCDKYEESVRQVIKQKDKFKPELPVIALKEEASEIAIQEAMKSGAVDLVSLSVKKRLLAVITRELRALRAERALNSTIQSASTYKRQVRDLMKSATAAIALVQEGIVVQSNEPWQRLLRSKDSDVDFEDTFSADSDELAPLTLG